MTAAEKLRALAKSVSPGPWYPRIGPDGPTVENDRGFASCWATNDSSARYIAALHPGVVEEIAALLEIAERGHAIQFQVRYEKLAGILPPARRCSESYMAVTVPDFKPMLCPECHQTVGVEDDGRGHGQLIAHDVNGEPWKDDYARSIP